MRFPTKYIATYSINGGEEIHLESPNLHLLDKQIPVSYTHLTLPTILRSCRSRWSPYH